MRKFVFCLMLLLGAILGSGQAEAASRHRFVVVEGNNPHVMAQLVRASMQQNAMGRAAISDESCRLHRACSTPEDMIDMLQRGDNREFAPKAPAELAAYLDTLIEIQAPVGQYWMACKTGDGSVTSEPKWDCMTRQFHKGETCFADPKTRRCVFARDCTNPVGREQHEQECVELHVGLKPDDEVHIGWLGPDAFPSGQCKLSVQKTGEQERTSYDMDECPRDTCDFSGPAHDLGGLKVWDRPRISWTARVQGDNIIRLPREVLQSRSVFVLCVVRPKEGRQTHGKVVERGTYVRGRAYVTYQSMANIASGWEGKPYFWRFMDGGRE